ncbi:pyridoxal phosphate-dependent aminotransferase family protein [Bacteriovoracales bacterium]|nr:pyridoxal phosphate-dependent aminotransferase family protein [Bacteriovoracales bacterium]
MINSLEQDFHSALHKRREEGVLRKLRPIINPSESDFFSNDYLGHAHSNILKEKIENKIKYTQKSGSTGSRLLSGNSLLAESLEKEIAVYFKAPAALLFNSGYDLNMGLLPAISNDQDIILIDQNAHASLKNGAKLSNAKTYFFRHNNLEHLQKRLENSSEKGRHIFVITESVFSMDGDLAPLEEQAELCQNFGAHLIVDEAHGAGVLGEEGKGLTYKNTLREKVFARIITFGKAFGVHGAALLGTDLLKQFLVNFCHSFIYTTALPEHSLFSIRESLYFHKDNSRNRANLKKNIDLFSELTGLEEAWLSPIFTLFAKENKKLREISDDLKKERFAILPIFSPTVQKGSERLRICLHSFNKSNEITRLADKLKSYSLKMGVYQ